jgi:hypothetical protein
LGLLEVIAMPLSLWKVFHIFKTGDNYSRID